MTDGAAQLRSYSMALVFYYQYMFDVNMHASAVDVHHVLYRVF